jgi:hypothetical protein
MGPANEYQSRHRWFYVLWLLWPIKGIYEIGVVWMIGSRYNSSLGTIMIMMIDCCDELRSFAPINFETPIAAIISHQSVGSGRYSPNENQYFQQGKKNKAQTSIT